MLKDTITIDGLTRKYTEVAKKLCSGDFYEEVAADPVAFCKAHGAPGADCDIIGGKPIADWIKDKNKSGDLKQEACDFVQGFGI